MVKKSKRRATNKDTKSQKRRKKRLQHNGIAPPTIHKEWDRSKTLEQNYDRFGLIADVNKQLQNSLEEKTGILTEELNAIAAMPAPPKYVPKSMNIKEQNILRSLIQKYGESNVEAMAKDIKINIHQWTEAYLKKRIELYKQLLSL